MSSKQILARLAHNWLTAFVDPWRVLGIASLPRYFTDWRRYSQLAESGAIRWRESYPCLTDWASYTPFDAHFFYQACWAARKLATLVPAWHVDVGSSVMMLSVISAFVPTMFVDYRPFKAGVTGLSALVGDLLSLPFANSSVHSLSCLHVVEHIGLGRYGDLLDPQGSAKAARELIRVLAPGGRLLLSTLIGRERVQFNAHRIFAPQTVLSMFDELELVDFAMVDDGRRFRAHADPVQASGCEYVCGMFEFARG